MVVACLTSEGRALAAGTVSEADRTAAAVLAVDAHWLRAETGGDTGYIERLLLPDYRSVGANGNTTLKAKIVADTANNAHSDRAAKMVRAYLATHPMGTTVTLDGDVAIVSFYSKTLGPSKGVMSSDVFEYVGGRWRAIYSQHTTVGR